MRLNGSSGSSTVHCTAAVADTGRARVTVVPRRVATVKIVTATLK